MSDQNTNAPVSAMTDALRRQTPHESWRVCATCRHAVVHHIDPDDLVRCFRINNFVFRDDTRECDLWEARDPSGDRDCAQVLLNVIRDRAGRECDSCRRGSSACRECFVTVVRAAADKIEICL